MTDQSKTTKNDFCLKCGFQPKNRSQAIAHAAKCGPIVRASKTTKTKRPAK